jgi:phage baseplate assembly protein W
MSNFNFIDFYIGYPGHPRFKTPELIEDDVIRVIIQKYEMILFTNKGDLFGDPNFGCDLIKLLHETRLSAETIESDIRAQITTYINEIEGIEYGLKVEILQDPDRFQEYMIIEFNIRDYEVYASVE